jgi:transposase
MNYLDNPTRAKVVSCLIEGCSIRATVRMTGVSKTTIIKLLADLGDACATYHDRYVRNLRVRHLQADEIWQFVGAKAKNARAEKKQEGPTVKASAIEGNLVRKALAESAS